MNNVTLTGRLTADPELRQINSGEFTTSFSLAVGRKPDMDGNKSADFPVCVAWGKKAEFICRNYKKGIKIEVIGELRTRKYEDRNGTKHYITEVLVRDSDFAESKKAVGADNAASESSGAGAYDLSDFEEVGSSDLPF